MISAFSVRKSYPSYQNVHFRPFCASIITGLNNYRKQAFISFLSALHTVEIYFSGVIGCTYSAILRRIRSKLQTTIFRFLDRFIFSEIRDIWGETVEFIFASERHPAKPNIQDTKTAGSLICKFKPPIQRSILIPEFHFRLSHP